MKTKIVCILLALIFLYNCSLAEDDNPNSVVYVKQKTHIYTNAREADSVCVVYPDYPLTS